jgi:site-specific DNA recombinase
MKSEQERIARELDYVDQRLSALDLKSESVEANLKAAFAFVGNLANAYQQAAPNVRRRVNPAMFVRSIFVSDDGDVSAELRPPFDLLLHATGRHALDAPLREAALERPRGPRYGTSRYEFESIGGPNRTAFKPLD